MKDKQNGQSGTAEASAEDVTVKCYPEVYVVPPPQPKTRKPGQLTQEQVETFFSEGFLVVDSFFTKEELEAPIQSINSMVENLANKLYNAGKIKDKHEKASFYERLTLLEKEFPGASILMHKRGTFPKGFQELWSNERMLNVMEQFLGPDVAGHPIWNLRTKTPSNESTVVPWHQDNAYFEAGGDKLLIATAWIPLIDANVSNGCMQVVRRGHRKGMTTKHTCCAGPTWYVEVEEEQMEKALGVNMKEDTVTCEVPFGGVLFINNIVPHRSLRNESKDIRWSMDLRYHKADTYNYYYGLKKSILFRSSKDPNLKIDWSEFLASAEQHKTEEAYMRKRIKLDEESRTQDEEFDTTLYGPWMTRWEILHHNRHTRAWEGSTT